MVSLSRSVLDWIEIPRIFEAAWDVMGIPDCTHNFSSPRHCVSSHQWYKFVLHLLNAARWNPVELKVKKNEH